MIEKMMANLIYGVGVNDAGYNVNYWIGNDKKKCPYYRKWCHMLERCYSVKYQERHPTYVGCKVCESWLTFSNFKKWMIKQEWEGLQLDKDIISPGNKIYSPENCCFINQELNNLFTSREASRGEYPQGVSLSKTTGKYEARISIDGKRKYLGYYSTVDLAELAYISIKREYILSKINDLSDRIKQGMLKHAELLEERAQELMKTAFIISEE